MIDVRVDVDHSEVDAEGEGEPDWGCEVLEAVDVESLEGQAGSTRGLELMSRGRFWEAHEVLEAALRSSAGQARDELQFLIRCCAAAVHLQRGDRGAAARIAARAVASLDPSRASGGLLELRSSCASADPGAIAPALRRFARSALEASRG